MATSVVDDNATANQRFRFQHIVPGAFAHPFDWPTKPLLKWDLGELLTVANAAKCLPEELQLDPRLDPLGIRTVRTDTIRQVRNFVHPARYFRERAGKPYTAEEVRTLYATCHAAYDCLINRLRAAVEGHAKICEQVRNGEIGE